MVPKKGKMSSLKEIHQSVDLNEHQDSGHIVCYWKNRRIKYSVTRILRYNKIKIK